MSLSLSEDGPVHNNGEKQNQDGWRLRERLSPWEATSHHLGAYSKCHGLSLEFVLLSWSLSSPGCRGEEDSDSRDLVHTYISKVERCVSRWIRREIAKGGQRGSRIIELGSWLHRAELQTHAPTIQFCIFLQSYKMKRTEHTYLVL